MMSTMRLIEVDFWCTEYLKLRAIFVAASIDLRKLIVHASEVDRNKYSR